MDTRPNAFGSFRVRTAIGTGLLGPVYRGYDPSADRAVVICTFESPELKGVAPAASELLAALRRLCEAKIEHPGIARPLDCGVEDGVPFLILEHLAGHTMEALLNQDGPRPPGEVLQRVGDLAAALDFAASSRLHHGALSPGNVICDLEATRITWYGIVQALIKVGLPVEVSAPYASPQRTAGTRPTRADDIYSLAALTLELLIGLSSSGVQDRNGRRLPRPAAHETRAFTRIAGVDAGRLRAAFAAGLADEASRRPSTAEEFVGLLREALATRRTVDPVIHIRPNALNGFPQEDEVPLDPSLRSAHDEVKEGQLASIEPDFEPERHSPERPDARPPANIRALTVAASVAIGLAIGFGTGFVLGEQRGAATPAPLAARSEQPPIPPAASGRQAVRESPPPPEPVTAAVGQSAPSGVVEPSAPELPPQNPAPPKAPAPTEDAAPPPDPAPPVERVLTRAAPSAQVASTVRPSAETAAPESGALQILSRPAGAQVFLDENLVGTTPLLVSNLVVGSHRVRLESDGHQSWTTFVRIAPGKRFRLSASLGR